MRNRFGSKSGRSTADDVLWLFKEIKLSYPMFLYGLNDTEYGALVIEWQKGLENIAVEFLGAALTKVKRSQSKYAPNLGEFRQLCAEADPGEFNFKSIRDAYLESYRNKFQPGKDSYWSHVAVYVASETLERNGTAYRSDREIFAKRYRRAVNDFLLGRSMPKIPEVRRAIESKRSNKLEVGKNHLAKMREQLKRG